MELTKDTKISELLKKYPFLTDELVKFNPKFKLLKNRVMRATMGRVATLSKVASVGEVDLAELIATLERAIRAHNGGDAETADSPMSDRQRLEGLKEVIRAVHAGKDVESARERFAGIIADVSPEEIARMEQELIREGLPAEEIQRLCDLHVGVFRQTLDEGYAIEVEPGHPVDTFRRENEEIVKRANRLGELASALGSPPSKEKLEANSRRLIEALDDLGGLETHYVRKENQLFPFLEKHDFTGPSQVMWGIHDEIRKMVKDLKVALETGDAPNAGELIPKLVRAVVEMVYKEEKILFPTSLELLTDSEWREIRAGEHEIGYAYLTSVPDWSAAAAETSDTAKQTLLELNTGALSLEQIDLMLTHLPIEASFVDENDEVRYYSGHKERIFPRSPAVIGRKVQHCHPPRSVHMVNRILSDFRAGRKDSAEFWIQMNGRFLYIRYFAVRNDAGEYRGTLEVTQDVTAIRKLEGQQRLLDWDDA